MKYDFLFLLAVAMILPACATADPSLEICLSPREGTPPEKIVVACTQMIKSPPTGTRTPRATYFVYPLLARGDALLKLRHPDLAVADYDRVIEADPSNAAGYKARCWARAVWGHDLSIAIEDCNQALQMKPDDADLLDSRGFADFRMGKIDEAIKDETAALALTPKQADALYVRGLAEVTKGDAIAGNAD